MLMQSIVKKRVEWSNGFFRKERIQIEDFTGASIIAKGTYLYLKVLHSKCVVKTRVFCLH